MFDIRAKRSSQAQITATHKMQRAGLDCVVETTRKGGTKIVIHEGDLDRLVELVQEHWR